MTTMLAVHLVSTLLMVGVIWVIQLVHYPLFKLVGCDGFIAYERSHTVRIGFIVIPVMCIEAAAAALLVVTLEGASREQAVLGAALLAVVWLSTFLIQVPCHERLAAGFDDEAWRRLVRSNWIRTLAWTVRGWIALALTLG